MQADGHFRVGLAQFGHRRGQHIPRLRVGGGNGQRAAVLSGKLVANAAQVAQFAQDDVNAFQHMLARLGHAADSLAMAGKNLNAQFLFQLDDGFGHPGLGGVQCLGGFGQVEVAANRFLHKFELVKVHGV